MSSTQSLGAQLRATAQQEEHAAAILAGQASRQAEFESALDLLRVENFFADAKARIELAARFGRVPAPLVLGRRGSDHNSAADAMGIHKWRGGKHVTSPTHRFNPQWVAFEAWATGVGLTARFAFCHDGMGVESWEELEVLPA